MFRASPSPTVVVAALLALAIGGFVTVPASAAVPPAHESVDALLGADLARGVSPLILDEARGPVTRGEARGPVTRDEARGPVTRDEARGFVRPELEARGFQPAYEEARGFVRPELEARGFQPAYEEARGFVRPELEARGFQPAYEEARGFVRPELEARGFQPAYKEARGFVCPDLEARGFDPRQFDVAMGGHIQSLIRQNHDESRPVDDTTGAARALLPLTA